MKDRGRRRRARILPKKADISKRAVVFQEILAQYGSDEKRRRRRSSVLSDQFKDNLSYPHPDIFFLGETKFQDLFYDPMKKKLPPLSKLLNHEFFDPEAILSDQGVSPVASVTSKDSSSILGLVKKLQESMKRRDSFGSYFSTETSSTPESFDDNDDDTSGSHRAREQTSSHLCGSIHSIRGYDSLLAREGVSVSSSKPIGITGDDSMEKIRGGYGQILSLQNRDPASSLLTKEDSGISKSSDHTSKSDDTGKSDKTVMPVEKARTMQNTNRGTPSERRDSISSLLAKDSVFPDYSDVNKTRLDNSSRRLSVSHPPPAKTDKRTSIPNDVVALQNSLKNHTSLRPSISTIRRISTGNLSMNSDNDIDMSFHSKDSFLRPEGDSVVNMIHEEKVHATLKRTMQSGVDSKKDDGSVTTHQRRGSIFDNSAGISTQNSTSDEQAISTSDRQASFSSRRDSTTGAQRKQSASETKLRPLRETIRKLRAQSFESEFDPFYDPDNSDARSVEYWTNEVVMTEEKASMGDLYDSPSRVLNDSLPQLSQHLETHVEQSNDESDVSDENADSPDTKEVKDSLSPQKLTPETDKTSDDSVFG